MAEFDFSDLRVTAVGVVESCREAERDSLGIEHDEETVGPEDAKLYHPDWVPCGTWADHWVPDLATHYGKCPHCPKERVDTLDEGSSVTLFGKPGTVRWVLPGGRGVAVVFEDGQMFWAYSEHIGQIEDRD